MVGLVRFGDVSMKRMGDIWTYVCDFLFLMIDLGKPYFLGRGEIVAGICGRRNGKKGQSEYLVECFYVSITLEVTEDTT